MILHEPTQVLAGQGPVRNDADVARTVADFPRLAVPAGVGQRLAEKREYRDGDGYDKVPGADETQLQRSRGPQAGNHQNNQVEQGQVEGDPRQIGTDRPGHR